MSNVIQEQQEVCKKYGTRWVAAPDHLKVGIARNVRTGLKPLNGLRQPPQGGYIWAGEEFSTAPDFFEPMHVAHLAEHCPAALRFLGLPPGWCFLTADDYVDVWEDPKHLDV
jgi:hypothetical protein